MIPILNLFNPLSITFLWLILFYSSVAQKPMNEHSWSSVTTGMSKEWYGSDESEEIAQNVLLYQRNIGGWPKNIAFHKSLTKDEKDQIQNDKNMEDAIFDNGATTTEMRFLAKMYLKTANKDYRFAVEKGLRFILNAQYENGGWPMFYPLKKGYYTHITFNDDVHFRLITLLKEIILKNPLFAFINDQKLIEDSKRAWDRGIDIILKTQIEVNGKPTVWCAQHDENTFLPAKARAYELPSFSGAESVGLLEILMEIENPSPEIIGAVQGGIDWLDKHRLKNTRWESFTYTDGKTDRRIINDPKASDLWARFYDLDTALPFVSDRDGKKKSTLDEIGYERRNGYNWYSTKPQRVLDAYPKWKSKWVK